MANLQQRRAQTESLLNLARIRHVTERQVDQAFQAAGLTDITYAQANVLMWLFQERAPATAAQIADALSLSTVTISRFVRSLEQHGWIGRKRHPDDARAMLIEPTERAYATLPTFIDVSNALLDTVFDGFSDDEIEQFIAAVDRIHSSLERYSG